MDYGIHLAINTTSFCANLDVQNYRLQQKWFKVILLSSLTPSFTVFDGIVIRLKELIKVPLRPTAGLCDYNFLLFQLIPQTSVVPSVSQLVQHLIASQDVYY